MRSIVVAGTNLYAVVAAELGDATQWYRIAVLNRIDDPMIFGLTTLQLPDYDPSTSGGVPST